MATVATKRRSLVFMMMSSLVVTLGVAEGSINGLCFNGVLLKEKQNEA
jgi:hypothetical protein